MKRLLILYCLVNTASIEKQPIACWNTRAECSRAVDDGEYGGYVQCRKFSQQSETSENFNINTTQAQSCVAGGLNPDCTPKR